MASQLYQLCIPVTALHAASKFLEAYSKIISALWSDCDFLTRFHNSFRYGSYFMYFFVLRYIIWQYLYLTKKGVLSTNPAPIYKAPYLICYLICAHGVEICIFYCVSRKSSSKLLKP